MTSTEIFNKCQPKSPSLSPGIGGKPEVIWEDIILAIQGAPDKHYGFINYVYVGEEYGRPDFFAGLYIEAMGREDVQRWWKIMGEPKHAIENMVRLAMKEWKFGKKLNGKERAGHCGVSPYKWNRHYKSIYSNIAAIPAYWEDEILRLATKRLRR